MWRADELGQISWGQTGVSNFAQRNLSAAAVPRLCPSSPLPWSTILALIPASTPATAARSLARRLSVSASARHSAPQWMKFFVINLVQERGERERESAFDHPRSRWPWWSTRALRLPAALIRLCCRCGGRQAATKHIVYLQQYQLVLPRPRSHCTVAAVHSAAENPFPLCYPRPTDRPTEPRQ